MLTFTWFPNSESTGDTKTNVIQSKFGDGYEARTPNGLNSVSMEWSLTFTKGKTEAAAILAFLKAHKGSTSFNWTTPENEAGVYLCRAWSRVRKSGLVEVTAKFEQIFSLI